MLDSSAPRPQQKGPDQKFCSTCGALIHVRAEICPQCGVRQMAAPVPMAAFPGSAVAPNGKSRLGAALFAFFLGSFGAHKFYLGQPGLGVLYLLFFWTGIPGLIGVVEMILYLVMSDEEFAAKYGRG